MRGAVISLCSTSARTLLLVDTACTRRKNDSAALLVCRARIPLWVQVTVLTAGPEGQEIALKSFKCSLEKC